MKHLFAQQSRCIAKGLVFSLLMVLIFLPIGLVALVMTADYLDASGRREVEKALNAPTETIVIDGIDDSYTQAPEWMTGTYVEWGADRLVKSVKQTEFYTINDQNDVLVNIYVMSGNPLEAKVYVKNEALLPASLDAAYISAVTLIDGEERSKVLHLSETQIQYFFDAFLDQENGVNEISFSEMNESDFSDEKLSLHFYLRGVDGLYFKLQMCCRYCPDTEQYYLQYRAVPRFLLLPEDIQYAIKAMGKTK